MKRLATKSDRLNLLNAQINSLLSNGYEQEDYKGLKIFTKEESGKYILKIYKGTSTNLIAYAFYRNVNNRNEAIVNYKASFDRTEAYKEECKKNPTKSTAANCAAAIKAELKGAFPLIKFSVKSDNFSGGNSVHIKWENGPTTKEVEAITRKYQYGHFNGMEDIYEYSNSREDIPQAKFVSTHREMSEEVKNIILPQLTELLAGYDDTDFRNSPENILYRIFSKTSFQNAPVKGIERTEITAGFIEDFYTITFEAEEKSEVKESPVFEKVESKTGEIQIIDYSEKAIAVIGDTKPIKEKLKRLGGKFNFRLSCGPGWIFPKSKLETIKNSL